MIALVSDDVTTTGILFCGNVAIFVTMSAKIKAIQLIARSVTMIVLISAYALFSVGIIKATHFCMGREASVVFFSADAKKCPCSLFSGARDSCCDDAHELVKIEDEQQSVPVLSVVLPVWFELEKLYTAQLVATATPSRPSFRITDPSPSKVPRFKIYCSFVFYDGLMA